MDKKKIGDIIFKIVIIILLIVTLFINNDYDDIKNRKVINNIDTYEKYKSKTYVTFDLNSAEETRFMVESKEKYKTYLVKYEDKSILIVLSPNTVLTSSVNLIKMKDNNYTEDVKDSYKKENPDTNFLLGYYTNNDLKTNESIVNYKLIATYVFILLLSIFLLIDIVIIIRNKVKKTEPELDLNNNI